MNATVGKLSVETPDDRPEIIMTRTFHAPRDLVFRAHSSCEHVSRWWGPRRHSFASCDMDFVEGGAWRYVLRDADGTEYPFKGEFREIQAPKRLTWTFIYDVEPFNQQEGVVETILFNEEDGKTETVSKWGVRVPQSTFDAVLRDKADDGIIQNNRLAEKRRGALEPDYLMPVQTGAITRW